MPLWSRFANVFRGDRLIREIDEELQSHLDEAVEQGRDPAEARQAFGSPLRNREKSRDVRLLPWLESLRADAVFGWRQLMKRKAVSAAAILSLGLAIGSCTAAFRLIDALLLRPLPVAHPERLYALSRRSNGPGGGAAEWDTFAHPSVLRMRAAVKDRAEVMAISSAGWEDLAFASPKDTERAHTQYVSGWMFGALGIKPAVGRLFTEADDRTPGAHPYAVLSHDYWRRRFGEDPQVVGRTFRLGAAQSVYEIIGVAEAPFTGTETGTVTDLFLPTMMRRGGTVDDWTWLRVLVRLQPGVVAGPVHARLAAASHAFEEQRTREFAGMGRDAIAQLLDQKLLMEPAASGASGLQRNYRRSLAVLGALVVLVLLIACANVANLMTAHAAAREREMALRVSIGAGRRRLVQLVLVESAWLASLATAAGWLFAWQAAPFVVGMINPPDNPARLSLPIDWRALGFGLALTLAVTFLFGLVPALRASTVKPAAVLKGGEDPHARRRLMHALIAAQTAFSFVVVFIAGLFVATFDRLSHRPLGFSADRVIALETVAQRGQPPAFWEQITERLRFFPGVEKAALAEWPALGGGSWNGLVSINGAPPTPVTAYFQSVSPGWMETMRIPLLAGRDFLPTDAFPGAAIVNETFVKQFFPGVNPLGKMIAKTENRCRVVGVVRDAPYRTLREPIQPVAYVPFHRRDGGASLQRPDGNIIVRTSASNPLAMASLLRQEVSRARPEFRVRGVRTQTELVEAQTIRERLLALLAAFFGAVALLLAGVGLYGVLDYSVLQRRREIGIRMALGAQARNVAWRVASDVFVVLGLGALAGVGLGLGLSRYVESLLYEVKATDTASFAAPSAALLAVASLAALPALIRAIRIDPVAMLRTD